VALIGKAKADGVRVTASVTAHHLLLDESALHAFEENYKVSPPLRTDADRKALIKGLKDGTIDCIVSDHSPQDTEAKEVEFEYAADGMVALESAFGVAWKALKGKVPIERVVEALAIGPRNLLGLEAAAISEGEAANLTLFAPDAAYTFGPEHLRSKSRNTPFAGINLQGKVIGAIRNKTVHLNP
jgi:dihydroorotase